MKKQYDERMKKFCQFLKVTTLLAATSLVWAEEEAATAGRVTHCQEWSDRIEYVLEGISDPTLQINQYCTFNQEPAAKSGKNALKCVIRSVDKEKPGTISAKVIKPPELSSQVMANGILEARGYILESRCTDDPAELITHRLWKQQRLKPAAK